MDEHSIIIDDTIAEKTVKQTDVQALPEIAPDQFEVLSLLGTGGMSSVYLAKQKEPLDRLVAIKVLHKHLMFDAKSLQRFKNEAIWTSRLQHPNIVTVYSSGVWDEQPFIAMEYVEGKPLTQIIASEAPLDLNRTWQIAEQLLNALTAAHREGLIHRDLKPHNIMLVQCDGKEQVKVLDFGVAKLMEEIRPHAQKLTGTGVIVGSPQYMSPEQFKGQPVDASSDLYSLSCILFEMLLGTTPYKGNDILQLMRAHLEGSVPRFADVRPSHSIPGRVELVIRRGLQKDPSTRFKTADEFAAELKHAVETAGKPLGKSFHFRVPVKLILVGVLSILAIGLLVLSKQSFDKSPIVELPAFSKEEYRQFLLRDGVWNEALKRLASNREREALIDACFKYAEESGSQDLRARALFRRARFYSQLRTEMIVEAAKANRPVNEEELTRLAALSQKDLFETMGIVESAHLKMDANDVLRHIYSRIAESLDARGQYDEAGKFWNKASTLFKTIKASKADYFWHYYDMQKNAASRKDFKQQSAYIAEALACAPYCITYTYVSFESAIPDLMKLAYIDFLKNSPSNDQSARAQLLKHLDSLITTVALTSSTEEKRTPWIEALEKEKNELDNPAHSALVFDAAGRRFQQMNQLPVAEEFYREAIKRSGQIVCAGQLQAWYHLAQCLDAQQKSSEAALAYKEAIRLAPLVKGSLDPYIESYFALVQEDLRHGRFEQALTLFDTGINGASQFVDRAVGETARISLVQHKAAILIRLDRPHQAVDELNKLQRSISDELPLFKAFTEGLLVEACCADRDWDQADQHLREAKEIAEKYPSHETAAVVLGTVNHFSASDRTKKAFEAVSWTREFARRNQLYEIQFAAWVLSAKVFEPLEKSMAHLYARYAAKCAEMNKLHMRNDALTSESFGQLGAYYMSKDRKFAERCFLQGVGAGNGPHSEMPLANNLTMLGVLYSQEGNFGKAEQCFLKAQKLYGGNYRLNRSASHSLLCYARHRLRTKDRAGALKMEQELVSHLENPAIPSNQTDLAIEAYTDLAEICSKQGLSKEANHYATAAQKLAE